MTVKLPPGTPLRDTDALVRDLQREHAKDDGISALYGVSGSGTRLDANPTESGENIGKLTVVMEDGGSEEHRGRRNRTLCAPRWPAIRRAGRLRPSGALQLLHAAGNRTAGADLASIERAGQQAGHDAARRARTTPT